MRAVWNRRELWREFYLYFLHSTAKVLPRFVVVTAHFTCLWLRHFPTPTFHQNSSEGCQRSLQAVDQVQNALCIHQLRALLFCCFDFWEAIHFWFFPLLYSHSLWFLFYTSVWFSSVTQSCPTLCNPWPAARQASLSITNSWSLLSLMSIVLVMPSNHLILCHPLLLSPSIFLSIRVFSNESVLHIRWPKYWSFGFSISPSNEHSRLISFRMDWLDLLAVQRTLKSLL